MVLQTQSDSRRLEAANAPRLRRPGKAADWLLSIVFASLLCAAVWRLDHATTAPPNPAPIVAHAPNLVARSAAIARELLETLIVRDGPKGGLSAAQSAPEGWPMWSSEQAHRPPSPNCVRPDGPHDAGFACD